MSRVQQSPVPGGQGARQYMVDRRASQEVPLDVPAPRRNGRTAGGFQRLERLPEYTRFFLTPEEELLLLEYDVYQLDFKDFSIKHPGIVSYGSAMSTMYRNARQKLENAATMVKNDVMQQKRENEQRTIEYLTALAVGEIYCDYCNTRIHPEEKLIRFFPCLHVIHTEGCYNHNPDGRCTLCRLPWTMLELKDVSPSDSESVLYENTVPLEGGFILSDGRDEVMDDEDE
ncbi:MAG: hypothetical protein M1835_001125 [Candelina submexicana]|nr:MAG: hypothetical protein M1835_001125 [Candelina submexicana]